MNIFHDLANTIDKIEPIDVFVEFAKQRKINDNVIQAIQKRLYQKGITGDGVDLTTDKAEGNEYYAPLTISLKSQANEPDDRVTLFDTGEFYDSMVTMITKQYYIIDSDFEKDDGHMQENFKLTFPDTEKFEQSVLSLSEDEIINILINEYLIFYKQKVNESFTV